MLPTAEGSFEPGPHFTHHVTPMAALRSALGQHTSLTYVRGCHDSDTDDQELDVARDAAAAAELAIVFVGAKSGLVPDCTSGEARDAVSLDLPGAQTELVEIVASTGTPTVVVVVSGRVHTLGGIVAAANATSFPSVQPRPRRSEAPTKLPRMRADRLKYILCPECITCSTSTRRLRPS